MSYTSKAAKIKPVILPSNTSSNVNVLLSNITFLFLLPSMYNSLTLYRRQHVYKMQFFYILHMLFYYVLGIRRFSYHSTCVKHQCFVYSIYNFLGATMEISGSF